MPGHPSDTEIDAETARQRSHRLLAEAEHRNDAHRDERMETADRKKFLNRLRLLRFIEQDDLRRVGVNLDGRAWHTFSANPYIFLIRADDTIADAIFRLIQLQETRGAS